MHAEVRGRGDVSLHTYYDDVPGPRLHARAGQASGADWGCHGGQHVGIRPMLRICERAFTAMLSAGASGTRRHMLDADLKADCLCQTTGRATSWRLGSRRFRDAIALLMSVACDGSCDRPDYRQHQDEPLLNARVGRAAESLDSHCLNQRRSIEALPGKDHPLPIGCSSGFKWTSGRVTVRVAAAKNAAVIHWLGRDGISDLIFQCFRTHKHHSSTRQLSVQITMPRLRLCDSFFDVGVVDAASDDALSSQRQQQRSLIAKAGQ